MSKSRSKLVWLIALIGIVAVVGAVVYVYNAFIRQPDQEIAFCPDGGDVTITAYHRSALDGHVEKVELDQARIEEQGACQGMAAFATTMDAKQLEKLPVTILVAKSSGKEMTTAIYRLPNAEGFYITNGTVSGTRPDRHWPLFFDDTAKPVDAAELPKVP